MASYDPPSGIKFFSEETRLDELTNDTKVGAANLGTQSSAFVYMGSTIGPRDYDYICFTAGKSGTLTVSLYSDSNTLTLSNTEIYLDDVLSGISATPYQNLSLSVTKGSKYYFSIKNYKLYQTAEFYAWQFTFSNSSQPVVNTAFCDDGWNNYLYNPTKNKLNTSILGSAGAKLNAKTTSIFFDEKNSVDYNGWNNYVGTGNIPDEIDYVKIKLDTAAVISFTVNATDATKFTVCDFFPATRNGQTQYKEKSLLSKKLSKLRNGAGYSLTTNKILLEEGEYYLSIQSTNVNKGGSAFYNVYVNQDDSFFFTDSDDGWNNDVSKARSNPVWITRGYELPVIIDSNDKNEDGWENFVGFDDKTDFAKLNLASSASVSFRISTTGSIKFQIWKFDLEKGKLSKVGSATSLKPNKLQATASTATKEVFLDAGGRYEYFISVESKDAAKGGFAYYDLSVYSAGTSFFDSADNGNNNVLYDKKAKTFKSDSNFTPIEIKSGTQNLSLDSNVIAEEGYSNYVGYGDPADYAKLVLSERGILNFSIEASADATFQVSRKIVKRGKETLEVLGTANLKLASGNMYASGNISGLLLNKGEYYVSMTAKKTTANAKGCVFYNVTADATLSGSESSALAMPELPDNLGISDALGFGGYDTDALAGASASALADLDDKSAWLNIASLA